MVALVPHILTAGPASAGFVSSGAVGIERFDVAIPVASFQVSTTVADSSTPVSGTLTKLPFTNGSPSLRFCASKIARIGQFNEYTPKSRRLPPANSGLNIL